MGQLPVWCLRLSEGFVYPFRRDRLVYRRDVQYIIESLCFVILCIA